MVQDPYKTLHVSHSASALEIKRAYREKARKYHPDKYVTCPDEDTKLRAASQFAACASAYALLSDPKRKDHYDHIYKFGGYDSLEEDEPQHQNARTPGGARKRKSVPATGIGYTCHDPCAFLWSRGKVQTRRTVAGIQVPSRIQDVGGIRFAFSSGHVMCSPSGVKKCISQTTHFSQGRKCTRKETHIYHPDGLKEVVIEGGGNVEREFTTYTNLSQQKERPWYWNAWTNIQDKLSMCSNPCAAVQARHPSQ